MSNTHGSPVIRIVDDDPALLEALSFMLSCEGWSVVTYSSPIKFLEEDDPNVPGVLVLDVRMPEITGPEVQAELVKRQSSLPVIFLTAHAEVELAVTTLRAGAFHFLQKPVQNEIFLSTVVEAIAKCSATHDSQINSSSLDELTQRERQVANLLAKGLLNRQIAERLNLSIRTVEVHRASVYRRLGVHSIAELARCVRSNP